MADNKKSVNLLPEYLRTDKNAKFLSGTIDQFIQTPQLERIDGYVGSKVTPNFDPSKDVYIKEDLALRRNYQLEPALVFRDEVSSITDVIGYDDIINELTTLGAKTDNLDTLLRSKFYSYDPLIDWDKLINYTQYYWLPTGPEPVVIDNTDLDLSLDIINQSIFVMENNYSLSNGMKVVFTQTDGEIIKGREYIVEGVGTAIQLVDFDKLEVNEQLATTYNETFDSNLFDDYPFDGDKKLPIIPEYITINRSSRDLNPWSRYNRWVHKDVIETTALINEIGPSDIFYGTKAERPIIEFKPNLQLYNFGTVGVANADLIDTTTLDIDRQVNGTYGFYVDGVLLEEGQRVIFNATTSEETRGNIYETFYVVGKGVSSVEISTGSLVVSTGTVEVVFSEPQLPKGITATGVAVKTGNTVTSVVITNPGWGYFQKPTVTFTGTNMISVGDSSSAATVLTPTLESTIELRKVEEPNDTDSISINRGLTNEGTSWHYDAASFSWVRSQQHTKLNEAPLFDLFDQDGVSYTDAGSINDFQGTQIFGYDVGTGVNDSVLGFPLNYKSNLGVGSFPFKNYFMTDIINVTENDVSSQITSGVGFIRVNNQDSTSNLINVWKVSTDYQIPVIELQTVSELTNSLTLTCLDRPASQNTSVIAYVNNQKVNTSYVIGQDVIVTFVNSLNENDVVRFVVTTDQSPNQNGYYETPLSLTNNPLNGPASVMNLSELTDHLSSMVATAPGFAGEFPGSSNLRDLANYSAHGTRFITNDNPISFVKLFLGKKEHNLVDAIQLAAEQYSQLKMSLLTIIRELDSDLDPADALDYALKFINKNKDSKSAYYRSDMIAYGSDKTVREYTVSPVVGNVFPIVTEFSIEDLSFKSVLTYLNGTQLVYGTDYTVDSVDNSVVITTALSPGDLVKVVIYNDTLGSYVPSTPTKLGLYPKFEPVIYDDDSYASGTVSMIRGHDGSLMQAYGDYRDAIIIEFERRIYNNIKVSYNPSLFDVTSIVPGAFRNSKYSLKDANDILRKEFIRWAGTFNVDVSTNSTFNDDNSFTWNFKNTQDLVFNEPVSGTWRAVYSYFYDTDRPHTHPWEMLGITSKPTWWDDEYGSAPYTSANTEMWTDLEDGYIRGTSEYNADYARPGLTSAIPVDASGNLKSPDQFLVSPSAYISRKANWVFGDWGPAETAWRKSSYWPYAVNILSALLAPCDYTSSLYDVSRTTFNSVGQKLYNGLYLNPKNLVLDDVEQIAGFGVFVAERGKQKNLNYLAQLEKDLKYLEFNLFHKMGGFGSKDKLQIIIDSVNPSFNGQSAILPPEDYSLILNSSNPIKSASISGIIVQKNNGNFVVKGYDKSYPYFKILAPIKTATGPAITVGGKSSPFTDWSSVENNGNSGLDPLDLISAQSTTTRYYKQGQIVRYNNKYYRVKVGHAAQSTFDTNLFQQLSGLPITGGVSVQRPAKFDTKVTEVSYGTEFTTIQEVYDLILGYGAYLEGQGFIFDEYNTSLNEVLDWSFTGKEFLFWTTQNWANNNLITLSPFANKLKYQFANSIVDNIVGTNYEYSLLKADGKSFPIRNFNLTREDSICTIETVNTEEGIFFATLNSIQKEHAMVFNNTTVFNDTIFDIETGYKQRRVRISGFRTAQWNGDLYSPGFVNDSVQITDWKSYEEYNPGAVVRYNGSYYESIERISSEQTFDFNKWVKLPGKPVQQLIPNFDYKINQFEDFYSLDIDNFDSGQQQLSQHLLGYTQRPYLTNIFTNPTTQYKFYQGFIKEKGTKNAIDKISKAGSFTRKGSIDFNEEWAFRIGHFGGFETLTELEFPLDEGNALENPYLVKFVNGVASNPNNLINYTSSTNLLIKPDNYVSTQTFETHVSSYDDTHLRLTTAGYVRLDDVTATAYNKNSLLDIANNGNIKEGDTVWLGFLENGDWNVYRYTRQSAKIAGVFISAPAEEITFTTDQHHSLSIGDIVSVVNFNDQVNGVYVVTAVPELNQFAVASQLSTIVNEELLAYGALFKFKEVRFNNHRSVALTDSLFSLSSGSKIWVDNADGRWSVYEKVVNYNEGYAYNTPSLPPAQQLGHTIHCHEDSNVVMVSAPAWNISTYDSIGRIWVLERNNLSLNKLYEYILNSGGKFYCDPNSDTDFGYSLSYDISKELYVAGAPTASNVRAGNGTLVYSTGTGTTRNITSEGVVKISGRKDLVDDEVTERVIARPVISGTTGTHARFGHSVYINQVESTVTTLLLISAPGDSTSASTITGTVYSYLLSFDPETDPRVSLTENPSAFVVQSTSSVTLSVGDQWGYKIAGDKVGSVIAISAPTYSDTDVSGLVQIFEQANDVITWKQTLLSPFGEEGNFGHDVVVSESGKFVIVSAPEVDNTREGKGKVAVYYKNDAGDYELRQTLDNPVKTKDLTFGQSIAISKDETVLVIGSLGKNRSQEVTFDVGTRFGETTFDQDTTQFVGPILDSGAAYVYSNLGDYFVQSEELNNAEIIEGSRYGNSVAAINDVVFVGAPWYVSTSETDNSTFFQFNKIDVDTNSWKLLRVQPDVVNIDTVKRVCLINSTKEEIVEYLDVVDPVKGKIAGLAEQELKYKSAADPAIYSIGIAGTVNDTEANWIDEHVGELWWDLSTAKYTWYEQGDEVARKNNWGKLFPGATIDVYEWIRSDLLPAEWAAQADTSEGLTNGISGQPKYPDNSVISVKQVFNNVTGSFENVYYYWVKNKVTVPDAKNRRISSYQVASLIEDPAANGLKFAEIIAPDAIALANVQPMLTGNQINANISIDVVNNTISRHTEWLLLEEGNETSVPNTLLTKKLFDSLLGHDYQGNLVPDISLSYRNSYGIGIRPQQTLFKDRLEALRNLVEFANSVLIKNRITSNYSFLNLNKKEEIPDEFARAYDLIVEDRDTLALVNTSGYVRATVECFAYNGKVSSVNILNPGFGYTLAPEIVVTSQSGSDAVIETEIDLNGRVISVSITNPGSGYTEDSPTALVRPHTVIVNADADYGNRWTKHVFDYRNNDWLRIKTQSFNTPLYWAYVDWVKDTYNGYKDYKYVIDNSYELSTLTDTVVGDYVKVNNIGDGRYVILEKVSNDVVGDFSTSYNIVYSERGTIQILDSIWNYADNIFSYDISTLEETLYDQVPDLELLYILTALKDDIFVRDLKINWNLFFFVAVKYAFTEQKLLDWAFKTSFIAVNNQVGELDQRAIYKLDNEQYFEDYIKEVKPYRTKIRSYTSNYSSLDSGNIFTTDFDLPSYYNSSTDTFEVVKLGNDLLGSQPWKAWNDNYKFYLKGIEVGNSGSGYTQRPTIVITTATGDTGFGAKAEAYIRNGELYSVLVTNPGSGYVIPPIVTIEGGGSYVTSTATVSVVLGNDTVRKNTIGIKFDRVSTVLELGNETVTYTFPACSGVDDKFVLPWLAEPNKSNIIPLLDGKLVLSADYTIEYYTEETDSYTKKYSRFVFLNYIPKEGQVFRITYKKNINLLTAVDRINQYYSPTDTMLGNSLPLLMSGAEYGATQIQGLPFSYSAVWGQGGYDQNAAWSNLVDYYASSRLAGNVSFGDSEIFLTSVDGIGAGQRINITNTSTKYLRTDTVVVSVNTLSNSIVVSDKTYQIQRASTVNTTTNSKVIFYTVGEFNTYIQVNDKAVITGVGNGYDGIYSVTDVGIDKFVATFDSTPVVVDKINLKSLTNTATVFIPSILGNINTGTFYREYYVEDNINTTDFAYSWLYYKIPTPTENISGIRVFSSSRVSGGDPETGVLDTLGGEVEKYRRTDTSTGTVIEIYNLGPTQYQISVYTSPLIEFWKDNFTLSELDSEISAGSWNSAGEFVGALGVNPEDLTVDGSSFLNPELGYAPEELVKGQTLDSLSVNVYTQDQQTSALSVNGSFQAYTHRPTEVDIGLPLEESIGIIVEYQNQLMRRVTSPADPDLTGPHYSFVQTFSPSVPTARYFPDPEYTTTGTGTTRVYESVEVFKAPADLGFEFNIFGQKFDQVFVSPNGALYFGGPGEGEFAWSAHSSVPHVQYPAIYVEFARLWHNYGPNNSQQLSTGNQPGVFWGTGEYGAYKTWTMKFAGTHYSQRDQVVLPAVEFEVTLYSNGYDQYIHMCYYTPWTGTYGDDTAFLVGVASPYGQLFEQLPYTSVDPNSKHVFYSKASDGVWHYVGRGSVDPNKAPFTFSAPDEFFVYGDKLYLAPQANNGRGSYTLLTMSGDRIADTNMITVTNMPIAVVTSNANINDVKSAYVTVNGLPLEPAETTEDYGYMITTTGLHNNRAAVTIYNLPNGQHTIQAWFLKIKAPVISKMYEENFEVFEAINSLTLTRLPAAAEPFSAQVLVEMGVQGDNLNRKRLTPPAVSYYKVSNNQKVFKIDNKNQNWPAIPLNNTLTGDVNIRVFVNGDLLSPGFDYTYDSFLAEITVISNFVKNDDVIAIETQYNNDFIIYGNLLKFNIPVYFTNIKVTTFSTHDNALIRTEKYKGTATRRFKLSLPAYNARYIWVYVNGSPLNFGRDFELLDDNITVQLTEWVDLQHTDDVIITSINNPVDDGTVVGYRVFKDIFDRVSYMRLAEYNSTRLSRELLLDDTEIHVEDSSRLISPNPYNNQPGVIFVDSERIEFFELRDNVLSNLRRSTMGTAPAIYSEMGTKVLDQSPQQFIMSEDVTFKQKGLTSNTTTYYISTLTTEYSVGSTSSITLAEGSITIDINKYESVADVVIDSPTLSTQTVSVVFSSPELVTGKTATGRANISGTETTAVTIVDSGYGYIAPPSIVFTTIAGTTGTGTVVLTDSDQYKFREGWRIKGVYSSDAYFEGVITSVGTGSMTISIDTVEGTGSFSSWTITPINVLTGNGITTLSTGTELVVNGNTSTYFATNQISVKYGGRHLRKNSIDIHDPSISYDTSPESIVTIAPEYSVVYDSSSEQHLLELNIENFTEGLRIDLEHKVGRMWQPVVDGVITESILTTESAQAKFLRDKPAALPDMYYYGGDPVLTDQDNQEITDDNDDPIEGY